MLCVDEIIIIVIYNWVWKKFDQNSYAQLLSNAVSLSSSSADINDDRHGRTTSSTIHTQIYIYINNNFEYFEVVKYFTLSDHSIVLGNRNVMTDDRRTNRDELKLMTNDTSTVWCAAPPWNSSFYKHNAIIIIVVIIM